MKVSGEWLSEPGTQAVLAMLEKAGHQAYCVGGSVRNALLDQPVADVDIATDARPERVADLATAQGFHAVPTGAEHGTMTVVVDHIPHEVTTFRRDVETDGRRAVIAYADTIEEDARRRDFTMNALYACADGTVLDPLGGLADIAARRVRFIEDAAARVAEDYLRILRFFRFHAWYGDPDTGLDVEGLAACAAGLDGLGSLSRERIGAELKKLLAAPDPAPAVAAMVATGVLLRVLPGADAAHLPILVHLERASGCAARWQRRLSLLGTVDWTDVLRLSRAETRELAAVRMALSEGWSDAEAAWRAGGDVARDAALVRAASLGVLPAEGLESLITAGQAAIFPVSAADLIGRYGAGPALGAALKRLEEAWVASGFVMDHTTLMQIDKAGQLWKGHDC